MVNNIIDDVQLLSTKANYLSFKDISDMTRECNVLI